MPLNDIQDSIRVTVVETGDCPRSPFWVITYPFSGKPLDELALIRRAQITTGTLVSTYEDVQEDLLGRLYFSGVGIYSFQIPDGREFKASTGVLSGEVEKQQEVEYLPDNPRVNRIKGKGSQSVFEWLWRNIGLGSLLLFGAFLSPVIFLLRYGVRKIVWLRLHSTWRLLEIGMNKQRVREILGEPHNVSCDRSGDTWSYDKFGMHGYLHFSLENKVCKIFSPLEPSLNLECNSPDPDMDRDGIVY